MGARPARWRRLLRAAKAAAESPSWVPGQLRCWRADACPRCESERGRDGRRPVEWRVATAVDGCRCRVSYRCRRRVTPCPRRPVTQLGLSATGPLPPAGTGGSRSVQVLAVCQLSRLPVDGSAWALVNSCSRRRTRCLHNGKFLREMSY